MNIKTLFVLSSLIGASLSLNAEFAASLQLKTSGYTGEETLQNFPLLVRLSSEKIDGFDYSFFQADGKDMQFTNEDGSVIYKHEIDTWNVNGESLVWVLVPELTKDTTICMNFADESITEAPSYSLDGSLWRDAGYTAVWHLGEPDPDSETDGGTSYDATKNNLNAKNSLVSSPVQDGVLGIARNIGSANNVAGGGGLIVENWSTVAFTNTFTVSTWVRHQVDSIRYDTLFSTKPSVTDDVNGWGVGTSISSYFTLYTFGMGRSHIDFVTPGSASGGGWQKLDIIYDGSNRSFYTNGVFSKSVINASRATENTETKVLAIGSNTNNGQIWKGDIDETRFAYGVIRSADWISAEYSSQFSDDFISYGSIEFGQGSLSISGDIGNYGNPTPNYGIISSLSSGDTFTASLDEIIVIDGEKERYVNLGYSHYTILDFDTGEKELVQSGEENSFEYVHQNIDELVWHLRKEYFVTINVVGDNGTASFDEGWCADGSNLTFTVNPVEGYECSSLLGVDEQSYEISGNTVSVQVASAMDLEIMFVPVGANVFVRYVSTQGSDENDGFTQETAKGTIKSAIESIDILSAKGTVFVAPGRYEQAETITISNAIDVVGITGKPEDVVLANTAAGQKIFILNNSEAMVANLVAEGGSRTYGLNTDFGGNIRIDAAGGVVSNCVIRNASCTSRYPRGIGIYLDSEAALVTQCVITNNYISGRYDIERYGIGVHIKNGTIENSLVADNYSNNIIESESLRENISTGGIYIENGAVINCTVVRNKGHQNGGIYATANAFIVNTVAVGNELTGPTDVVTQAYDFGGNLENATNCVAQVLTRVEEGAEAVVFPDTNSCLVSDASSLFRDYAAGDFFPKDKSILINKGTNLVKPSSEVDLKGKARISYSIIDIGAYEYSENQTIIIIR